MRKLFVGVIAIVFLNPTFGQLTKGTWLVGGAGSFYSSTTKSVYPSFYQNSKEFNLAITSTIGYFVADKLAVGLSPAFSWGKGEGGEAIDPNGVVVGSGGYFNAKKFLVGPFGRYYLLNTEKPFNIVAGVAYQRGFYSPKPTTGAIDVFSAAIGPVIYFNSAVGLEFSLGYSSTVEDMKDAYKTSRKGFQAGIGLQVHLE